MDPYSENTPKAVLKKKNQNCSVENEDEPILEDMIGEVDFSFDLQGVHSDLTNIFEKFVQKELIKSALRKQYAKAKKIKDTANVVTKTFEKMTGLDKQREKIKQGIKARKTQLEKTLTAPPFLRTSDKFAFTLGIVGLCLTEFILLRKPEVMPTFYAFLIIPLLTARYYFYHKQKYHYFMLDFCYYVQVLLLVHLFLFKTGADFFQVLFSMSNGPLCVAIVMWRNSLVFHDLDKITSVFIHIFPPLVTFCMRWFPINGDTSSVCLEPDCHMSVYYAITLPFLYYCVWQALYLFKTEILDGEKIRKDNEIMTSVKWLTQVKPHPIYLLMKKYGLNPNPVGALVVVQGIYTLFTLLPNLLIFEYFEVHVLYLIFIFVVCVWNGANFYFEVFSDTYALRLKKHLKEAKIEKESETIKTDTIGDKIIAPSVAQEQVLAQ